MRAYARAHTHTHTHTHAAGHVPNHRAHLSPASSTMLRMPSACAFSKMKRLPGEEQAHHEVRTGRAMEATQYYMHIYNMVYYNTVYMLCACLTLTQCAHPHTHIPTHTHIHLRERVPEQEHAQHWVKAGKPRAREAGFNFAQQTHSTCNSLTGDLCCHAQGYSAPVCAAVEATPVESLWTCVAPVEACPGQGGEGRVEAFCCGSNLAMACPPTVTHTHTHTHTHTRSHTPC